MNPNKMQLKDDSALITGTGKELQQKCMDILVCVGRRIVVDNEYREKYIYFDCGSLKDDT